VKKLEQLSADSKSGAELPIAVKDSAQQIWLAGLGAFAKAQEEGGKVFDALVKEGMSLQRKSQIDAEERISGAAERMTTLANNISIKATGQWDKLENIFEGRVSKALKRLGVPSANDIEGLSRRIEELTQEVRALSKSAGNARRESVTDAAASPAPAAAPAKRTPRKKADPKKLA
ncbi:MAG: phasin family protein, partial [Burkholderiales bacterium]